MIVHCTEYGDEWENEDMYDLFIDNDVPAETSNDVQNHAHGKIIAGDSFTENKEKQKCSWSWVIRKNKCAHHLMQRLQVRNRR